MNPKKSSVSHFEKISTSVTKATGSTTAFMVAFFVIILWLLCGPLFKFSDTWQLVINTGTTIITFLMVFLIQRCQNKDSIAIHLKLNELIVSNELANNRLVSIEDISENELMVLQSFYKHLSQMSLSELSVNESHSLNKANAHHYRKKNSSITKVKNNNAKL